MGKLIDADELIKDDEVNLWLSRDAVRTGKTLKMFSELFIKKIDEQPTIQAVPIDVLDKIRAEIENDWQLKKYPSSPFSCGLRRAIELIDKYKAESENP